MNPERAYALYLAIQKLNDEGMTRQEIRQKLSKRGWRISARQVVYYLQDYKPPIGENVVENYQVPMIVRTGWVWAKFHPGDRTPCEECQMYQRCMDAVRRLDFVACEVPLEKELFENYGKGTNDKQET